MQEGAQQEQRPWDHSMSVREDEEWLCGYSGTVEGNRGSEGLGRNPCRPCGQSMDWIYLQLKERDFH